MRMLAAISLRGQCKMQTMSRLREGENAVVSFGKVLQVETSHTVPALSNAIQDVKPLFPEKNFAFPKMHQLTHLFEDIRRKGTVEYLGCMLGENFHQGLIRAYQASNKKDTMQFVWGTHLMLSLSLD
jgi:hypothetical protein